MPPETAVAQRPARNPVAPIQEALARREPTLAAFLPSEQVRERFLRIVYQAVQKNPDLMDCTAESIAAAAVEAAMYGLEPSGAAGGAHLVPFRNREKGTTEAVLIVDYRGQLQLARDSDKVEDAFAVVVRKADHFRYDAANQVIEHMQDLDAPQSPDPGDATNPMTHVYAVIVFRSGYRRPEVMSKAQVDAVRAMSRAANGPAWRTSYLEMAKKTVLHRALKTAPLRPGARAILERDPDFDFDQPRVTVEPVAAKRPQLAARLRERRQLATSEPIEHAEQETEAAAPPGSTPAPQSPPAGAEAGEAPRAPDGEAVPARAAASPLDTSQQEGTPAETSGSAATTEPVAEGTGDEAPDSPLDEAQRDAMEAAIAHGLVPDDSDESWTVLDALVERGAGLPASELRLEEWRDVAERIGAGELTADKPKPAARRRKASAATQGDT